MRVLDLALDLLNTKAPMSDGGWESNLLTAAYFFRPFKALNDLTEYFPGDPE